MQWRGQPRQIGDIEFALKVAETAKANGKEGEGQQKPEEDLNPECADAELLEQFEQVPVVALFFGLVSSRIVSLHHATVV